MNIKINTICFIILLFLLIGVVHATDSDNETLKQTIEQPDDAICRTSVDNDDALMANSENSNKLEASVETPEKLEASKKVLASIKTVKSSKTKTSVKASNLKMYYKGSDTFTVTLKDSSKKAIKGVKIKVNVFGKTYTANTNTKGKASFKLNGAECGTFKAEIKYDGSKKYYGSSAQYTITVKSTIKSSGMTKYYTNTAAHSATFYDTKGKVLKNTAVKFKLNGKTYSMKTNKKGLAKLSIDLKPGNYVVSQTNPKTKETTSNIIQIKTILETYDLTMTENDASKFSVKVLNDKGKAASNKMVTLKVNGKTYTPKSNSKGIATQTIDLKAGKYSITTEYEGIVHTNQIIVNKGVAHTEFSHITSIPTYVNVTAPYAFSNSAYTVRTGPDGIIKLPKNNVLTVQTSETQSYLFSSETLYGVDAIVIGHETHLVPFDGSAVKSDYNRENLKGGGILISKNDDYIQIEYRSTTDENAELFGIYVDKGFQGSETITYLQNYNIRAMVNIFNNAYDETGLKYNLGKLYGKSINDLAYKSYNEITDGNADKIKFVNTGETVTYSSSGKYIDGCVSREYIITRLIVDGIEELEKSETISYGLSDKYQSTMGFEVLQSYAIINDRVTQPDLERWIGLNPGYMIHAGIRNVYAMFLEDLETALLADEIANQYAKELNVEWSREKTTTILGGINLDNTYLHILNADMGMSVIGDIQNSNVFRLMNSIYLPNIESYVLNPLSEKYSGNITNSLENILESVENDDFSIVQIEEMFYILSEDGRNTTIVINSTTGLANVLYIDGDFAYKGSVVSTACDCCSVASSPYDIMNGIKNNLNNLKKAGGDLVNNLLKKIHPLSLLAYYIGNLAVGLATKLTTAGVGLGLASAVGMMIGIHGIGNYMKNNVLDEKDWHAAYDHVTFTRDGYFQKKKFFNIPKSDGTYDYVEVGINDDGSLNRNDVLYVGSGYTKKLTKSETYDYFTEEKWTACNIPRKYQKYKVPSGL